MYSPAVFQKEKWLQAMETPEDEVFSVFPMGAEA